MTWIKSIKSSYDSDTKAVKWLHHWFPSVHVNKSLLQESTGRCYDTVKHNGNKMWGHRKIFHNRQHKIQKKICINRHIIKYYVITEHILIHGVAMEIGFGEWEMIPLIQALPLWPFIASHYLLNLSIARASSTHPHSPSKNKNGQLFPGKLEPKISGCWTRKGDINDRDSCLPSKFLQPLLPRFNWVMAE